MKDRTEKEKYERPELRVIELRADEVLAPGCKLVLGPGGPIPPTCTGTGCVNAGS